MIKHMKMNILKNKKLIYTTRMLAVIVTVGILSLVLHNLGVEKENVLMVFMVGVLLISTCTEGYQYGLISAVASAMLFNYFFTVPVHTFAILNPNDVALVGFFLIAAFISSSLTVRFQRQLIISKRNEHTATRLYEMSEEFINVMGKENIIELGIRYIYEQTGYESAVLLLEDDQKNISQEYISKNYLMIPIIGSIKQIGILKVFNHNQGLGVEEELLVKTAANQIGIAIDRELIYAEQEKIKVEMEREHMKSSMLRSISHDFRTPLTGIIGDCSVILESEEMEDAVKQQLVREIMEQSIWLMKMMENIMSMTKIESGQWELDKTEEVIDDVINEAVRHTAGVSEHRDFHISLPEQVVVARLDGKMIVQVIVNLLDNAVKHTKEGDTIILGVSYRKKRVYFIVEDEGEGIEEGMREKIFDEFVSFTGKSADQKRGIGLGLAICREVVEAHGGKIWAENRREGGARITFWLPAAQVE